MKPCIRVLALAFLVVAAVIVGCRSMYSDDGTGGPLPAVGDGSSTGGQDDSGSGFFVDGSHDIDGGGPPPPPAQQEEEGEETQSHFRAIQVDPRFEDTAGPKFIRAFDPLGNPLDLNNDGLTDFVTGHNQSQPVQIHLQQRDEEGAIRFQAITLGGTLPITVMAGIQVADMDQDGMMDVVVLVKHTGITAQCLSGDLSDNLFTGVIIIFFAPGPGGDITDADQWEQVLIVDSHSRVSRRWGKETSTGRAIDFPEDGGYTSLDVGDVDGMNGPDIVVASNVPEPDCGTGMNVVEVWFNPGANVRDGSSHRDSFAAPPTFDTPAEINFWYPVWVVGVSPVVIPTVDTNGVVLDADLMDASIFDQATIKVCELFDVDADGDLDIISGWSNAISQNVRWFRNPLAEQGPGALAQGAFVNSNGALLATAWDRRTIGQADGDVGALAIGDMDRDGFADVFVRDSGSNTAMWFRRPTLDGTIEPVFPPDNPDTTPGDNTPASDRLNIPWQVYVMDAYGDYRPNGIAVGDLTNDGFNDAAVAVGGALYWYDYSVSSSANVFDQWGRAFVLDDTKANGTTDDPTDLDFVDDGTLINDLVILDLDGDGVNDILATFDRRVEGGLADDTIIWFRNTLFDDTGETAP